MGMVRHVGWRADFFRCSGVAALSQARSQCSLEKPGGDEHQKCAAVSPFNREVAGHSKSWKGDEKHECADDEEIEFHEDLEKYGHFGGPSVDRGKQRAEDDQENAEVASKIVLRAHVISEVVRETLCDQEYSERAKGYGDDAGAFGDLM